MVEDVELWRAHMSLEHMGLEHMGLEHMDLAAHSAGAALAMLCAARYPHRIRRLVLITPNPSALGLRATPEDRLAAARLRAGEPWFAQAFPAFRAWLAGEAESDDVFLPFFHGRWDATARAHADAEPYQTDDEAGERCFAEGALAPDATRTAPAALTGRSSCTPERPTAVRAPPSPAAPPRPSPTPSAPSSPAPATTPGWTTRSGSCAVRSPSSTGEGPQPGWGP